jgi:mannose-6-phosphate isomerase-like protein (cupin superfamily)
VELAAALATFEQLWSPRIVTRVNDYDVRIAKVAGDHVWHAHDDTDEFFLVLDGELHIVLRDAAASVPDGSARASGDATAAAASTAAASTAAASAERAVVLPKGAVFVVPRGVEHRPSAPAGAHILMFEPTGTSTVGDRHDPIPGHVDATTGHSLT